MTVNGARTDAAAWGEHLALLGWDSGTHGPELPLRAARGRPVSGTRLDWVGPGGIRRWTLEGSVQARRTYGGEVWARLDGVPVISSVRLRGRSFIHVGLRAEDSPAVAAAVRRMLIASSGACAWLDLRGVVVLRMDDPGSCASVYLDGWRFDGLDEAGYEAIGEVARRHDARISIGFTPAWVDDGDAERGELLVNGDPAERVAGSIHPSALVHYRASDGLIADGPGQYRGLKGLRHDGIGSIELHGYTHVHPDRERWAAAESRGRKIGWFKEFAPENAGSFNGTPDDRVARGLEMFAEHFEDAPVALICPGHACSAGVLEDAYRQGLEMVCADRLRVRNGSSFMQLSGVPTAALDWGPGHLLETDAPVIAWFHDRDIAVHGVAWLDRTLEAWRRGGATMFSDLDELSRALGLRLHLRRDRGAWTLAVRRVAGRPLPRPFPVALRFDGPVPAMIAVEAAGEAFEAEVEGRDEPAARVMLPAGL